MAFQVINPATEEVVESVPMAGAEEVDAAVAAYETWRHVAPGDRARLLRAFADTVDAHLDELAEIEVVSAGHPIGQARWEAGNVRDLLLYYSAAPERLFGRQIPVAGGLEAGNLSVNSHSSVRYQTPFGGFKQSGFGRELGPDALGAFTETKNVFIATD
jgi:acyl-CoA reductase-like NAD-dependent aldehyde dehydrogenase